MATVVANGLVRELEGSHEYFNRSARVLEEADSGFAPTKDMMTVAQQVAHVAHTLDWFVEGATRPEGFDLDFAKHAAEVSKVTSLKAARAWYEKSHKALVKTIEGMTDEELYGPLPAGPVMGGAPRIAIIGAICEHTAHHRGALTVYSRLIGKVPAMPYMEG